MKWRNAEEQLKQFPRLAEQIEIRMGLDYPNTEDGLRRWIEDKVKYISVRPFDSLDLKSRTTSQDMSIPIVGTGKTYDWLQYLIAFDIVYTVSEDEKSWLVSLSQGINKGRDKRRNRQWGNSLEESLKEIVAKAQKDGKTLKLLYVQMHSYLQSGKHHCLYESYDIYSFPEEWAIS